MIYALVITSILSFAGAIDASQIDVEVLRTQVNLDSDHVTVLATAALALTPDKAEIRVVFHDKATLSSSAQEAVDERISRFVEMLATLGITEDSVNDSNVKAGQYRSEPDRRSKWARKPPGLHWVQREVLVYTDDLHLIDEICRDATFAGASAEYRFAVTFVATDTEEVQRIAREAVLARAATDAKVAASQNGVALGPLVEVWNERSWPNSKHVYWTTTSAQATHAEPFEVLGSVTVGARWALVAEK